MTTVTDAALLITPDALLHRIRAEYLEMPGLKLTERQAQRLWGLDEETCADVLSLLADARFLRRNAAGAYVRVFDGAFGPPIHFKR